MAREDELLDTIYEAAFTPHLWPDLLHSASVTVGATGAVLFATNPSALTWRASQDLAQGMQTFVDEGWLQRNTRTARLAERATAGFLTDHDIFSVEEMSAQPIYTEFLWPRALRHGAASIIAGPDHDALVMSFEGFATAEAANRGRDSLDNLRPHFARAGVVAARLAFERAKAAADALDALGLPAAVLRSDGRLLVLNARLEALDGVHFREAGGRCRLIDKVGDALLKDALADGGQARTFALKAREDSGAAIVHLVPVRRSAMDLFLGAAFVLVFCPMEATAGLPVDLLSALYDLTPAEARVASLVAEGRNAPTIAKALGVSPHTIRTQIKAVFEKTGASRQSELSALLASKPMVGPFR